MPAASRPTGRRRAPEVRVAATVPPPLRARGVAALAAAVAGAERAGAALAHLSITFVGPRRMRTLNREHLGHDRATDVIAFRFDLRPSTLNRRRPLAGDIYICPAVAARNARAAGATPRDEARRLIVHGVLHVLGHDHPGGPARQHSPMWRRQEALLARFGSLAR